MAHQLQLVWKKVLKKNPKILELIKIYFDAMSEFSLGKASTIFRDKAQELGNLVLSSKKFQVTRFVRSLVRGLRTAMQNLPTIVSILQEDYESYVFQFNNTEAIKVKTKIDKLKSPENLLKTIGIMQLLEKYASASLEGQYAKHFPTQVWRKLKIIENDLVSLGNKWKWSEDELKYSVLEAPDSIVKCLMEEGKFEPKLKRKNLVKKQGELRDAGLLGEDQALGDLFHEDEQVIPLSGVVIMEEETTQELVTKVERELSNFAKDITLEWKRRLFQTEVDKLASQLFTEEILGISETDSQENSEEDDASDSEENEGLSSDRKKRLKLLKQLIKKLPVHLSGRFDAALIFPGYESWLEYFCHCYEKDKEITQDTVFKEWYIMNVNREDAKEANILFAKLFQNIQIRSCSEAMAETVGSVMANHAGRNRHLQPHNFSKEIVLRFNLGSQHMLEELVNKVYLIMKEKKREFVFKKDGKGKLVSHLKNKDQGSAISSFRKRQEMKSKFPLSFWKE